jgi:GNAT superfamily N-acetyltransferase
MLVVRPARPAERASVLGILDGAALRTDAKRVWTAIEREDVLVATPDHGDRLLGALVLDGSEIANVAVRPGRRGQGIGRALVAAAADRRDRLVAAFDPDRRPFYEALGFDVEPVAPDDPTTDRLRGTREE